MPRRVTVVLTHDLGKEEARRRIEQGFGQLKGSLGGGFLLKFQEEWTSPERLVFSGKTLGNSVDGNIEIFPAHVRIEATLPNLLATIAETITGNLQKQGQLLLEKK